MAETIRGINVQIGAETTGLSKALSDVNQKSRDIQSELRQVEKLLKLDPSNTELVAQKQKLLSDAVANTSEKLDRLRAAQEQVNDQFKKGEINEAQYRAFNREIAAAEQALGKFEQQAKTSHKAINDMGDSLKNTGDKMKDAGEKMSIGLTAPIVAAGAAITHGAMEAENATGKLQAQLGLTAEQAADLGAVAKAVWLNGFGDNIGEATDAVKLVRQNMQILAEDDLQKVSEAAMMLADLFEADVKESTAAAGVMMKNFGIDGKTAMDLITVGFQKGGDYSGELLDTLREYSPQFATMGMSADQMMGILIEGAKAGAWNLDKVGDAVKEFNVRAKDGSKTTAEGFAAIGLKAEEMGQAIARGGEKGQKAFAATIASLAAMEDPVERNIAGVALFGTQWEDLEANVVKAMAEGVKGVGEFAGATEAAAKAAYDNNPGLALTMAMRELQSAIGPALLPLAGIIKDAVVPALRSMAEWFANLSPEGQKVVVAVAGIVAAIGPLLIIIPSIIEGFAAIGGVLAAVGGALAAITAPVAIAIAALVALVAAGVALYKNWDEIVQAATELWDGVQEVWDEFKQGTEDIFNDIVSFFEEWYPIILTVLLGPIGLLVSYIIGHWEEISEGTQEIWNGITDFFTGWWDGLVSWVSSWDIWSYAAGAWEYLRENVIDVLAGLANDAIAWGSNIVSGLVNGITGFIGSAIDAAIGLARGINDAIKDFLGIHSPSEVMAEFGEMVAEGLAQGMEERHGRVVDATALLTKTIKDVSRAMLDDLNGALQVTMAQFDLESTKMGRNAEETSKLRLEIEKLTAQKTAAADKLAVLTAKYEELRDALGDDAEATKDAKREMDLAAISVEKYGILIGQSEEKLRNLTSEQGRAAASIKTYKDELKNLEFTIDAVQKKYDIEAASIRANSDAKDQNAIKTALANLKERETSELLPIVADKVRLLTQMYNASKVATSENSDQTRNLYLKLQDANKEYAGLGGNVDALKKILGDSVGTVNSLSDAFDSQVGSIDRVRQAMSNLNATMGQTPTTPLPTVPTVSLPNSGTPSDWGGTTMEYNSARTEGRARALASNEETFWIYHSSNPGLVFWHDKHGRYLGHERPADGYTAQPLPTTSPSTTPSNNTPPPSNLPPQEEDRPSNDIPWYYEASEGWKNAGSYRFSDGTIRFYSNYEQWIYGGGGNPPGASAAEKAAYEAQKAAEAAKNNPISSYDPTWQLAEGGVVTKPTVALIGEGGDDEAVIPLPRLMPMLTDALRGAIGTVSAVAEMGQQVVNNYYTLQPGAVVIPAKDLNEMRSVSDFFGRFTQVSRAMGV